MYRFIMNRVFISIFGIEIIRWIKEENATN